MKNQPPPFRWLALAASLFVGVQAHAAQFPIATNATNNIRQPVQCSAFDGTNYLIGFQIHLQPNTSGRAVAQLVSQTGTPVGAQIDTGLNGGDPPKAIGFDGTNYLMFWAINGGNSNGQVFGQLISKSGSAIGSPLAISQSTSVQDMDAAAFDGTNYLVTWTDARRAGSGPGDRDIYGRRVSASGTGVGGDFKISGAAGDDSKLAFDGTNFLVIWRDDVNDTDIYGRLISPSGSFVTSEFVIDANSFPSDNPGAVIFDGTRYVVAFNDEVGGQGTETWDLFGRFVTTAGTVLTNRFTISAASGAQRFPTIAFDGINYLIAWGDGFVFTNVASSTPACKARFFDTNGMPASSEFNLFVPQGNKFPFFAPVLFDGTKYVAAIGLMETLTNATGGFAGFTNGEVYGTFISPLPRGAFPIAITSSNDFSFGAASDGTNYLVGIQGGPVAHDEITAQLVSSTGALVGPRISTGRFGGTPRVAFDGTNYLMVWQDVTNNPSRDIYGQFFSRAGALVRPAFVISAASGIQDFDSINHIVFDGSNYLVVWRDDRRGTNSSIGDSYSDIYGQLVTPAGTLFGAEIPIAITADVQREASAAFDGTNYLVTWQSRRTGGTELYDTYGKLISKTGVLGGAFLISQNPSPRHNPTSIAFDGTNYFVVWNRDVGPGYPSPTDWDIYARLVTRSGAFVGNEFPVTTAPGSQPFFGGVIYDGTAFLASWVDSPTSSLRHRFFSRSGAPLGSEFSLFGSQGTRFPVGGFGFNGSRLFALASFVDSSFSNGDVHGLILPQTRLDFAAPITSGQVPLRFTGMPGVGYAIQATTNLFATNTVWTTLTTSNTLGGTFNFTHTNSDGSSRRFYRAVLP